MVYKEANDLPVLQPEQEAKQKGWLEARMEGRRHKKEVNDVFASIIQNSKRIQSRNLFNYNIFLIGFMGAGKSTISDYLKNVLAMDVVEMDQCIVERQGTVSYTHLRAHETSRGLGDVYKRQVSWRDRE